MLPYRDSRLTKIILVVFFLLVLGYAFFEAQGALFGPSIQVPEEPTEVHEELITIKGVAERISSLTMNGASIQVTETGAFEEPYLLTRGLNRIVLDAEDKYGRRTQEVVEIIYTPNAPPMREEPGTATDSTPSTDSGQATSSHATPPTPTP